MKEILLVLLVLAFACGPGLRERWKSEYVEANGIRIHYWRTGEGSGKPVVVAAHGITDNGLCWSSLATKLENDYDLVLYDARGHGLSDKPDEGYEIEDHVADLVGLIEALGIERPFLMGHSMGGAIVAVAAAEHPGLARAVVLIDPAWLRAPVDAAADNEGFRQWMEQVRGKSLDELMDEVRTEQPDWPFEDWKPWAESKTQFSPKVLQTYEDLPVLEEYFPRIKAPVLILKADAPPEERTRNEQSAALLPDGKIIHIDNAGHSVHRDEPFASYVVIHRFLRRHR